MSADRNDRDQAFDDLFHREQTAVLRSVHLVVGDIEVARELTQEAFIRLYVQWARISQYDRPGAWVRRIAIRMAVKATRRDRRRRLLHGRDAGGERPARHSEMLDVDIVAALAALPAQQRAAVVLTYLEDLSTADVADVLGCSESTVRVHLHRARARLAALLTIQREDISDGT